MVKETLSYTVTLMVKDQGDPIVIADGENSQAGHKAAVDFKAGQRIEFPYSGEDAPEGAVCTQYIPYESIIMAMICVTSSTTTVEDAVCVEE